MFLLSRGEVWGVVALLLQRGMLDRVLLLVLWVKKLWGTLPALSLALGVAFAGPAVTSCCQRFIPVRVGAALPEGWEKRRAGCID